MGNENATMAGRKESASEKKADKNPLHTDVDDDEDEGEDKGELFHEGKSSDVYGNCGIISVLFETPSGLTPSGFAIFEYEEFKLTQPNAWQNIWADFVNDLKTNVWLIEFKAFEDKGRAINNSSMSLELSMLIRKHVNNGRTLAVGNEDYKKVIEGCMGIRCVYSRVVKELMWGLMIQIQHFLPVGNCEMTNEDRFPMSKGMIYLLQSHDFDINPHMMVTKRTIEMAGIVYECDWCVKKYDPYLRLCAKLLKKISHIGTSHWDLLKLATALKMICDPDHEISDARQLFSEKVLKRLTEDAPRYKDKISKNSVLKIYEEMYSARKLRLQVRKVLISLLKRAKKAYEDEQAVKAASDREIGPDRLKRAKKAYEDEQAVKAASDCEIGPDRKKICRGFAPVTIDELTSAKRKERQVPPTLAPVDALDRYTKISSHSNRPGILSIDIHPSKDIVATGGIDTNTVLLDFPFRQILCLLTDHLKKITSLKFFNGNGLFRTGSADKTVRILQGSGDENNSCIHTLKDRTAEVGEPSGQEGYIRIIPS